MFITTARNVLLGMLLLTGLAQPAGAQDLSRLFDLVNDRLALMPHVARYKHQHGIPVEDTSREQLVISRSRRSALRQGLDPDSTMEFFRAQIEVAKAIQNRYLAEFIAGYQQETPARDLETELRPALLALGTAIIEEIATALAAGTALENLPLAAFSASITASYTMAQDREYLWRSLLKIKLAEPAQTQRET